MQGHGHSNCLPSAVAAHPSDLAVRNLSPRARRCATRRRRRPLWWRALFRQALRQEPQGRALRLAAFRVRKALCPACGIRSVLYFGYLVPWAVTPVEHPRAGPHAIHCADSVNASLVSAAIVTSTRPPSFFRFFHRAPSSRFLLQPLSAVFFLRLLERRDPGLLFGSVRESVRAHFSGVGRCCCQQPAVVVAVEMWEPAFGAGFQARWDGQQSSAKIPL